MPEPEPDSEPNHDTEAAPTEIPPGIQVQPADQIGEEQLAQFVTTIKNAEQQVGEHIIRALQHADTVAVLTTVAIGGDGQQRVISAALNPERMQQVQEILKAAEEEREDEQPCVGFHCLVQPKAVDTDDSSSS